MRWMAEITFRDTRQPHIMVYIVIGTLCGGNTCLNTVKHTYQANGSRLDYVNM